MRTEMKMDERAQQLLRSRTPFVHATVVRAAPPTSAHAGDEAILLSDGTIEGFVGGHCAGCHGWRYTEFTSASRKTFALSNAHKDLEFGVSIH